MLTLVTAITSYQPRIKTKVETLIDQLQKRSGEALDATKWTMFLAFDIMGEIEFGRDFGNISSSKENPAIKAIDWPNEHVVMATQSVWSAARGCCAVLVLLLDIQRTDGGKGQCNTV